LFLEERIAMLKRVDRLDRQSTLACRGLPGGKAKEMVAMTPDEKNKPAKDKRIRAGFVPVTYASTLAEAELLKAFLEGEDIPTLVASEHSEVGGIPSMSRGIPVLVPDAMLEQASQLVQEHTGAARDARDDEDDDDFDDDPDDDFDDEDDDDDFDDDFDEDDDEDDFDEDED
jgi:hypothetical protein